MKTIPLLFGTAVAVLSLPVLAFGANVAEAADTQHDAAIQACSAVNPAQPVELAGVADDGSGIGFSLVWLVDTEKRLWMCDADDTGAIYTYTLVQDDLLNGAGPELIGLHPASNSDSDTDPQKVAEEVCVAYPDSGGTVLSSQPDGLGADPGYVIFVEDGAGDLYLCNATGDAAVWAFDPIGDPIADGTAVS